MRYMMQQKLFSWGKDFYIENAAGQNCFFVEGKIFSIGNQFSLQDLSGQELCSIEQQVPAWGSKYEVFHHGQLWATVRKELFTFFNCRFEIDEPGAAHLEAQGDFLDHQYVFTRDEKQVAEVSMKYFSITNTYGVDVIEGEEDVLILAATVVIDMACHQRRD